MSWIRNTGYFTEGLRQTPLSLLTIILNDPLEMIGGKEFERPLERGSHLVGEHHARVHHRLMQQLQNISLTHKTYIGANP
jgi:hypothetical protein